ncbi:hypothetical protein JCM1840_003415 [Sporobolomyces johnsonii]
MEPDPDLGAKYVAVLEKYSTSQEKQLALQEKLARLEKELGEKDCLIAELDHDDKQLHDAPSLSSGGTSVERVSLGRERERCVGTDATTAS